MRLNVFIISSLFMGMLFRTVASQEAEVSGHHDVADDSRSARIETSSATSNAAVESPGAVIDLDFIVTRALSDNGTAKDARISAETARRNYSEAKAGFFPLLSADAVITKTATNTGNPSSMQEITGKLAGETIVFDGLAAINRCRRSRCAWMAAVNSREAVAQELMYTAVYDYISACLDSEYVLIQEANVRDQRNLLLKIEAFKNTGQRPIGDYLSQKVYVTQAEIDLNSAGNDYIRSKYTLMKLIGDDTLTHEFRLRMPDIDTARLLSTATIPDSFVVAALSKRYDIRKQTLEVRLSAFDLLLAKSAFLPALTFGGTIGSQYSDIVSGRFSRQFGNDHVQKSLYLSMNIPLFDRLSAAYSVARANLQLQQAKEHLEDLKKKISIELREAYCSLESAKKQSSMSVTGLAIAEQALDAARKRYDTGVMTLAELFTAQSLVNQAKRQIVTSLYTIILQIVNIGYFSGEIHSTIENILP